MSYHYYYYYYYYYYYSFVPVQSCKCSQVLSSDHWPPVGKRYCRRNYNLAGRWPCLSRCHRTRLHGVLSVWPR
jgi:hypothetical protein